LKNRSRDPFAKFDDALPQPVSLIIDAIAGCKSVAERASVYSRSQKVVTLDF
jgi:hypothetical protein